MDHAGFRAWLDRYVDAWRLLDPVAIGDLFSPDVRYAFDPFSEAVVGRPAVVAAWLADPDEPGSWEADYEVLAVDGDTFVAHGRTRYLTDDRSGDRPRVRQHLRVPLRRRRPLPRVHRVVHAPPPGGPPDELDRTRRPARCTLCPLRPHARPEEVTRDMARTVRGALVQATWTGDKESMIQKHEGYAHEAAKQGAQFILFQELFYGPYFCQVQDAQYYSYTELIPDGPTTKRMQDLAKQTGHGPRRPDVRGGRARPPGSTTTPRPSSTPTARTSASTARPTSRTSRASGRSSTSGPGTSATRSSRRPSARSASTSATTATSPRAPGRSASTAPRSCSSRARRRAACRSTCGGSSRSATPSPTATSSAPSTGSASRPTSATTTSTARATSCDPRGQFVGDIGSAHDEELLVRDLDLDRIKEVRQTWQFYRDRRPDAYADLTRP